MSSGSVSLKATFSQLDIEGNVSKIVVTNKIYKQMKQTNKHTKETNATNKQTLHTYAKNKQTNLVLQAEVKLALGQMLPESDVVSHPPH